MSLIIKGTPLVVPAALGAIALLLAFGSNATGLLLPPDGATDLGPATRSATVRGPTSAVGGAWEQRVRIARHELTAAREDVESGGRGRLLLNVRDGVRLNVVVDRTAPSRWGYSLSGRVAGRSAGFVTLVVHEEAVAGSIWTPNSAYELSYLGGGVHALRDVTRAPPPLCGGSPAKLPEWEVTAQDGAQDGAEGSVVDILVVWTPAAEEYYGGGESQVISQIDITIASTNDAFERSGAFVSLRLVGAERVDYLEDESTEWLTALGTDLSRLANPDDGHMDQVHDRRDTLGADLVYLLTARGSGLASGGSFAVGGARVFAHEVGHNFGIRHERYEQRYTGLSPYEHGFTTRRCRATIMSYGDGCGFGSRSIPF